MPEDNRVGQLVHPGQGGWATSTGRACLERSSPLRSPLMDGHRIHQQGHLALTPPNSLMTSRGLTLPFRLKMPRRDHRGLIRRAGLIPCRVLRE